MSKRNLPSKDKDILSDTFLLMLDPSGQTIIVNILVNI